VASVMSVASKVWSIWREVARWIAAMPYT
jgi:hypothetical protein